ncbi:MAG: pectin methylesterase [Lachnospiraceae bacterium]|nr:pectin methylesterase [Lachnospiraceae bacterium]
MSENIVLHVNPSDNNAYATVAAALDVSLKLYKEKESDIVIELAPGIYKERLEIYTHRLTILGMGEDASQTVLTFDECANAINADGEKNGTFRTASLFIDADNVTLKNLTVENSAGSGVDVGQALALYADGDRLYFENCRFLGHQDTIFTAPLPPTVLQVNGFRGPKEFAPRRNQAHIYKDCYIAGDVDFIFGGAAAYFENCEIYSEFRDKSVAGYTTAASTPEGRKYVYVFNKCCFTSKCNPNTVYLGRPWRDFAKTVIVNSYLGEHIRKEGWHDWKKPQAHELTFYAEYNNYGPGADTSERVDFAHMLNAETARDYDFSTETLTNDEIFDKLNQ